MEPLYARAGGLHIMQTPFDLGDDKKGGESVGETLDKGILKSLGRTEVNQFATREV
jgi:hypothetical protein